MSTRTLLRLILGFVFCFTVLLMAACHQSPTSEQEKAVAAAKREVVGRGWKKFDVQSVERRPDKWEISLFEIPQVPGGHAVVEVSLQGQVIAYTPGD